MESEARFFLKELFGNKPEELYLLLWTLSDKRSRWFRDIDEAVKTADALRHQDVYVGVGLSREDFGPTHRCASDKVAGIVGVWADLDLRSEAHSQKSLPGTVDEALSIIPSEVAPTVVVTTGNGAHAWWLFREPWVFESGNERRQAAQLVTRWQTLLRLNAAARGWAFDRLADLARVLRIPGTRNNKQPNNPKPVLIHSQTGCRYNPSDLGESLDHLVIPAPETQLRAAQNLTERFVDKGLIINLKAEVPEDLIRRWTDADLRFRNTWFRQRHDLRDQSQSGYDLALACFGVDAGLSEQQIVDLIIHHRRDHHQKLRTRVDYFERTLARASTRGAIPPAPPIPPPVSGDGNPGSEEAPAEDSGEGPAESKPEMPLDPLVAKAALCEHISAILGIRILRLVKITGKEPTYQVELENGRIELSSVSRLIDQRAFRVAIASAANKIIPKIKPKLWEQLAQAMLDALVEREGGVEAEFEGAIRVYLGQYLAETAFIPSIEGQPPHAVRRPMITGDQIAVNSVDLQLYLNKTFGQNLSVKAIASMLSAIGARSIRVRGAQIREQGRWLLPIDQFAPADFTAQARQEQGEEAGNVESE